MGIITAGALWTKLYDATTYDTDVEKLATAICTALQMYTAVSGSVGGAAVGNSAATTLGQADDGESIFSVDDMRGELDRLARRSFFLTSADFDSA